MDRRSIGKVFIFGSTLLLGSCAVLQRPQESASTNAMQDEPVITVSQSVAPAVQPAYKELDLESPSNVQTYIKRGSGAFINKPSISQPQVSTHDGDITLNFEKTDIQEVVKVIMGDLLKENYVVGPGVNGVVNLHTSRPIGTDALLPMLENLLRMNGAVLLNEGGMYRINALADAARGTLTPGFDKPAKAGYSVDVVPLRYIAAAEMQKILEPFVPEGGITLVDDKRNLVMLAGSSQELSSWITMVNIFDVDWMKGYSVGLFPLQNTTPKTVADELQKVLLEQSGGSDSPGKMVRIEPIDRLNALLVITPQVKYLNLVKDWIEKLDIVGSEPGQRLFVYQVKNRKATELADIVNEIFNAQGGQGRNASKRISADITGKSSAGSKTLKDGSPTPADTASTDGSADRDGLSLPEGVDIRIVADQQNNSILVMASGPAYRIVESALKKLDVVPLQVLVEASILEVTLSDELSYGLEWYFKNQAINDRYSGSALLDLNPGEGIGAIIPGFSYAVVDTANEVNAILNMLASESRLNMLSSPSLMVLDNSQANIRVGEQVPVRSTGERLLGEQTIYETIEYKDTGVMLSVTPRVNSGGLVTMEIDQSITDIGAVESTTQQRKFLQRNINSEVAVQSGQTIVLGGLILEDKTEANTGIPGLRDVPILGWLFGATEQVSQRTELLVLITPRVVKNQQDAIAITHEFKNRMDEIQTSEEKKKEAMKSSIAE